MIEVERPGSQVEQEAKREADVEARQVTQQVAPKLDRLLEGRVERLRDLGLEASLLVPADRQVGEQGQLGALSWCCLPRNAAA